MVYDGSRVRPATSKAGHLLDNRANTRARYLAISAQSPTKVAAYPHLERVVCIHSARDHRTDR